MKNSDKPSILIIDDEPDKLRDKVVIDVKGRAVTDVFHPHDIEISDLESADIVLVDYRLENWPERDAQVVSLSPPKWDSTCGCVAREGGPIKKRQINGICITYGSY